MLSLLSLLFSKCTNSPTHYIYIYSSYIISGFRIHWRDDGFVHSVESEEMGNAQTPAMSEKSIFDFEVEDSKGSLVKLDSYKGKKAYLVVNVASKCGLTKTNYDELKTLYDTHSTAGLEILAFPCNNFGAQGKGSAHPVIMP